MVVRRLIVFVCLAVLASCVALGQDNTGGPQKMKPYVPRKIVVTPEPVTKDEAKKVFDQVDAALVEAMPSIKKAPSSLSGSAPITRSEIVGEFTRLFEEAKPEFKFTPKKMAFDGALLTVKDPAAKTKLEDLIAWGCIDRVGLLATSPKDTMGVLEFGDAVGFMLSRLAQLTHMPDPKFTPDLEP